MRAHRSLSILLVGTALGVTGCGGDDHPSTSSTSTAATAPTTRTTTPEATPGDGSCVPPEQVIGVKAGATAGTARPSEASLATGFEVGLPSGWSQIESRDKAVVLVDDADPARFTFISVGVSPTSQTPTAAKDYLSIERDQLDAAPNVSAVEGIVPAPAVSGHDALAYNACLTLDPEESGEDVAYVQRRVAFVTNSVVVELKLQAPEADLDAALVAFQAAQETLVEQEARGDDEVA